MENRYEIDEGGSEVDINPHSYTIGFIATCFFQTLAVIKDADIKEAWN